MFWEDLIIPEVAHRPIYSLHCRRMPKVADLPFTISFIIKDEANNKADLISFRAQRFEFAPNTHDLLTSGKPVVGSQVRIALLLQNLIHS